MATTKQPKVAAAQSWQQTQQILKGGRAQPQVQAAGFGGMQPGAQMTTAASAMRPQFDSSTYANQAPLAPGALRQQVQTSTMGNLLAQQAAEQADPLAQQVSQTFAEGMRPQSYMAEATDRGALAGRAQEEEAYARARAQGRPAPTEAEIRQIRAQAQEGQSRAAMSAQIAAGQAQIQNAAQAGQWVQAQRANNMGWAEIFAGLTDAMAPEMQVPGIVGTIGKRPEPQKPLDPKEVARRKVAADVWKKFFEDNPDKAIA